MEPVSRRFNSYFWSTCVSNELTAKARGLLLPHVLLLCSGGNLECTPLRAKLGWKNKFPSNMTPNRWACESPTNCPSTQEVNNEDAGRISWSSEQRAAAATHAFQISLILPAWRRDCHAPLATLLSQRGNGSKRVIPLLAFVTKSMTLASCQK